MKKLMNIFIAVLAVISILFIGLYIQRVTLPYNSKGRFFDPDAGVVYHQQTTDVIGMVALVLILLTAVLFIMRKKYK